MSRLDSVSLLRAAIQADVVRDIGTGHRQGNRVIRECPPFSFSYADGVAIDRGQEERLSVKDIAITPSSFSATSMAADDHDQRWDGNTDSAQSAEKEMLVLLRACESPTGQDATYESAGGVLHRWESMHGGFYGKEVISTLVAAGDFPRAEGSQYRTDSLSRKRHGEEFGGSKSTSES